MADAPQRDADNSSTNNEEIAGFDIPAPREKPLRAILQVVVGALVFAGLTAAYVWDARRDHQVHLLITESRPLVELGDVASLRDAQKKLDEALTVKGDERALAALAEVHALLWIMHGISEHEAPARQALSQLESDNVERAERYGTAALIAVHEGRFADAIKIGEDVVAKGGVSERLLFTTGLAQRATGKLADGRKALRGAQDSRSTPPFIVALGDAYDADEDRFNAHTFWANAAKINSNYVPAAARNVMVMVRKPEPEATILAELKRLDELSADDKGKAGEAAIELARAELFYYRGKVKESLDAVEKALGLHKSALALYMRARALQGLGKATEAVAAFGEALAAEPGAARSLHGLVRAHLQAGNTQEALSALEQQTDKQAQDESAPYHTLRGNILAEAGKFDEAAKAFDKALEIRDRHPEALLGHAVAKWKQKKYDEATGWFEKAVSARSKFPEVYEALGLMWIEQDAITQANTQLEEAERQFVAKGTDAVRLKQFYGSVIKAFSGNRKSGSYVATWTDREKKLGS